MKPLGSCEELARNFRLELACCKECHELYKNPDCFMLPIKTDKGAYQVCCRMEDEYEEKIKEKNG